MVGWAVHVLSSSVLTLDSDKKSSTHLASIQRPAGGVAEEVEFVRVAGRLAAASGLLPEARALPEKWLEGHLQARRSAGVPWGLEGAQQQNFGPETIAGEFQI